MSFASRLREKREELGLKQSELGKMLGVTGSAIGNYENGVSSPKADILYKVFDVLKCDANYLFQDEMRELDTDDLTVPEIRLAKKYRSLDQYGKEAVESVLDVEWRRCKQTISAADGDMEQMLIKFVHDLSPGQQEMFLKQMQAMKALQKEALHSSVQE